MTGLLFIAWVQQACHYLNAHGGCSNYGTCRHIWEEGLIYDLQFRPSLPNTPDWEGVGAEFLNIRFKENLLMK